MCIEIQIHIWIWILFRYEYGYSSQERDFRTAENSIILVRKLNITILSHIAETHIWHSHMKTCLISWNPKKNLSH